VTEHPSADDYIQAVQRPDLAFGPPELTRARFDVHPLLGIPMPVSGTTAVVFKATVGGTAQALRFFTREDASTRQRYTALNTWFTERGLAGDVASCDWIDDAILVKGRRWPMVRMEWVEGRTLDRHVEDLVEDGDRASLEALASSWRDLVRRAQAARFAHGDLQHGNVLVDSAGHLRLVDFDSSWIAPFAGSAPPAEGGHRNYQPANRVWGPWMDTFPGLVIYLSLLALAREPGQWEQLNDGENLLFRNHDYAPPYQTQAWTWVARLHDPRVDQLAARLRACCAPGWTAGGDLESLLTGPVPWWTRTTPTTTTAAQPVSAPPVPEAPTTPVPPPTPTHRPRPAPAPRPAASTEWWRQAPGAQPAPPAQPMPPQPAPAQPVPAHGRALRWLGTAGRYLLALVMSVLVWIVGVGLIQLSNVPDLAASLAFVPALIVFILVAHRRRRP
jgi:hypothetical protein